MVGSATEEADFSSAKRDDGGDPLVNETPRCFCTSSRISAVNEQQMLLHIIIMMMIVINLKVIIMLYDSRKYTFS